MASDYLLEPEETSQSRQFPVAGVAVVLVILGRPGLVADVSVSHPSYEL